MDRRRVRRPDDDPRTAVVVEMEVALVDRIGPGTLLAGRYRLQEQVHSDPVTTLWRAEDVTLERPVGVRVLSATHARVQTTLDAARRAALVDDRRLQRVHGVGVEAGSGYVVLEWITGQDAAGLAGKVAEAEAVRIVTEAAEALRTAASRQLHHGRIGPRQVVRASDGAVRVVGVGIEVAASGQATPAAAARPEHRDVRDLAAVAYALLTGVWPFGVLDGLPAAPTDKGRPVPAQQLRQDVTGPLDRLLSETLAGTGPETLDALVQQLEAVTDVRAAGDAPATGVLPAGPRPDDEREADDTDVITPVPAEPGAGTRGAAAGAGAAGAGTAAGAAAAAAAGASRAASGSAVAPPATGPVDVDLTATEVVGAERSSRPAARVLPERDSRRTWPAAGGLFAGRGASSPAAASSAAPAWSPPVEDDGWDLLPVGDDYDDEQPWADGPQPWDEQGPWETQQPWDTDEHQDDPSWEEVAGTGVVAGGGRDGSAAVVVPAGPRSPRRRPAGAGTGVAVVLVMGAFVAGGLVWALGGINETDEPVAAATTEVAGSVEPSPEPSVEPEPAEPTAPDAPQAISPAGVLALDPQGDGEENDADAPRAIDGDPGTAWQTQRYNSQNFGGLKTGLGISFDLGSPQDVVSVTVGAPGTGGTYEVRTSSGPGFDGSTVVATGETGPEPVELAPETPVNTQFVIVWFTALPDNDGDWRGAVSEVQVLVQ